MGGDVIEGVEEAGLRVCISWGQCQDIYKAIRKFYPAAVLYYFCVNFKWAHSMFETHIVHN